MSEVKLNNVDIEAVGGLVQAIQQDASKAQTEWSATVTWKEGFQSEAVIGPYGPILSDEPKQLGGKSAAPNPVEQVIAALGNCLAVGYAANATVKGIKLDSVTVDLKGDLNLKVFLGLEQGNAGYDAIRASVKIESSASREELEELHKQVVSTSPVGHTLTRAVPVEINLE